MEGSPYLHDLFSSVLVYDSRKVRSILKERFPEEDLITKFRIYVARKEFPLLWKQPEEMPWPFHFADVVWFISRSGERGSIVHEIKTGKNWKGAWRSFSYTQTVFNGYPIVPGHKNTLFCLWVWKKFYEEVEHPPWVKVCFLDWIKPILTERFKEIQSLTLYHLQRF